MSNRSEAPIAAINAALDDLADVDPIYQTTRERQTRLTAISQVIARAEADRLRVLAVSDDIALETGARSTAHWLAAETRDGIEQIRLRERLATAAGERTCAAMGEGAVNVAQAREIVEALERLPKDLDAELREKGEAYLVTEAAHFGPPGLKRLGARLLEVIAPDSADKAEYRRLLAEDRRARAATKVTFRDRGDGTSDVYARVPTPVARRCQIYLEAFTSPRRGPLGGPLGDEVEQLPASRRRGEAFCALLENLPTKGLPKHGGTATAVMVMIDVEALKSGTGPADTSTGDRLTAEQARRLACQAGILPVVLGGKGGDPRVRPQQTPVHRRPAHGMAIRDRECTADGCTIPAAWCEAHHHKTPWSRGGKTDLATASSSAPSTTTAPTTPAGRRTTTPTDRPPSTAGREFAARPSPTSTRSLSTGSRDHGRP